MCIACDRHAADAAWADLQARRASPLGISAKYVDGRRERFALQAVAADLVPEQRVRHCLRSVVSTATGVRVLQRPDGRARFALLQTCRSVWACPVCTGPISEARRTEMNDLLAWARREGFVPVLLTLTARHQAADDLAVLLAGMKAAKRRLRQYRAWRALKEAGIIVGTVTATELTHGANGWHPHFHELIIVRAASESDAIAVVEGLREKWLRALGTEGLDGNAAAFDVRGAAQAGSYVAKWGAAEELTLGDAKSGRPGQRTPARLLRDAQAGDERAASLWAHYARTLKGRRQLVWSDGLRDLAGIGAVTDAEAVEQPETDEDRHIHTFGREEWARLMVRRVSRAGMLEAVELGGRDELLAYVELRPTSVSRHVSRHAYRSGAPPSS